MWRHGAFGAYDPEALMSNTREVDVLRLTPPFSSSNTFLIVLVFVLLFMGVAPASFVVWVCLGVFFMSTCLRLAQMEQLSLSNAQVMQGSAAAGPYTLSFLRPGQLGSGSAASMLLLPPGPGQLLHLAMMDRHPEGSSVLHTCSSGPSPITEADLTRLATHVHTASCSHCNLGGNNSSSNKPEAASCSSCGSCGQPGPCQPPPAAADVSSSAKAGTSPSNSGHAVSVEAEGTALGSARHASAAAAHTGTAAACSSLGNSGITARRSSQSGGSGSSGSSSLPGNTRVIVEPRSSGAGPAAYYSHRAAAAGLSAGAAAPATVAAAGAAASMSAAYFTASLTSGNSSSNASAFTVAASGVPGSSSAAAAAAAANGFTSTAIAADSDSWGRRSGLLRAWSSTVSLDTLDDRPVCCVCLGSFKEGQFVTMLPCQHAYHQQCICGWLLEKGREASCPLCKSQIFV